MVRYVTGRLAQAVFVLLGAITVSFVLANLGGSPVDALGGTLDATTRARLTAEYGYDKPLLERFEHYVGHAVRGDFGHSFYEPTSALTIVLDALPYTLRLVGAARGRRSRCAAR